MHHGIQKIFLAIAFAVIGLLPSATQAKVTEAVKPKIQVVASFSILADIVRQVGGKHIEVKSIVGPNADAHIFRPSPQTAQLVAKADIVIINGLGFEGWIERLIKASGFKGKTIVATDGLKAEMMRDEDSGAIIQDPHTWHSVPNVMSYVKVIGQALQAYDPDNAGYYAGKMDAYLKELEGIDDWIRERFNEIDEIKRKFITAHDAFQYFGKEYGVTVLSPVGVTTENEASAKDVSKLIRQIRDYNIKAVFVENISNPRLIQQIANETGIKIGGTLYSDALSGPDEPADTYASMMRHNVRTILKVID